jgi:SulP family sulfate permease
MDKQPLLRKLLGEYRWPAFRSDLLAGLTVAAVAVPQAMAYALVAGVPPEYGLYTAIITTALGSLFGSSSHLINGPTNAISLVVFAAVSGLAREGNEEAHLQAVFLLAILAGLIQILIALLKLGDLTRYVSESVILGFMVGGGVLIFLGQLPNLLGQRAQGQSHSYFLLRFWLTVTEGGSPRLEPFLVGLSTIGLVVGLRYLGKRRHVQVPDMLLALLAVSLGVGLLGWGAGASGEPPLVEVMGPIPRTLPGLHVPRLRYDWLRQHLGSALAIALLGLLEALAIAKSIAARTHQALDYNKQALAEGLSNVGGGFFQCMPGSGSLTRSAINFHAGAATPDSSPPSPWPPPCCCSRRSPSTCPAARSLAS